MLLVYKHRLTELPQKPQEFRSQVHGLDEGSLLGWEDTYLCDRAENVLTNSRPSTETGKRPPMVVYEMACWKPERRRRASWRSITRTIMNLSPCFEEYLLSSPIDQSVPPGRPPKLLSIEASGSVPRYSTLLLLWLPRLDHFTSDWRKSLQVHGQSKYAKKTVFPRTVTANLDLRSHEYVAKWVYRCLAEAGVKKDTCSLNITYPSPFIVPFEEWGRRQIALAGATFLSLQIWSLGVRWALWKRTARDSHSRYGGGPWSKAFTVWPWSPKSAREQGGEGVGNKWNNALMIHEPSVTCKLNSQWNTSQLLV